MRQFNLYHHGANCYHGENAEKLHSVMCAKGYVGCWLTANQVDNKLGKYLFKGLKFIRPDAMGVTITKPDNATGEAIDTKVYPIEVTNFPQRYPAVWAEIRKGANTEEAVQRVLTATPMLDRAMKTAQAPRGFFDRLFGGKRVAAAL